MTNKILFLPTKRKRSDIDERGYEFYHLTIDTATADQTSKPTQRRRKQMKINLKKQHEWTTQYTTAARSLHKN